MKSNTAKPHSISYADWTSAEFFSALTSLLTAQVKNGRHREQLETELAAYYAPSSVFALNYAHTGLALALEVFRRRRPDRTEVLVPAYICPSVVKAVTTCGLTAVPVAVEDDLNISVATLTAALGKKTLAVVAPHMFGCPLPMKAIEDLCRDADVFLIDDAAQIIGVRQEARLLGTFGDVGLLSFAQSKTIVTGMGGSGGVLIVNNPALQEELKQACAQLPAPSGRIPSLLDFLWNYLWIVRTGQSGDRMARLASRLGIHLPEPDAQQRALISNLDAGIALKQLARLESIVARRQRVIEHYHLALQNLTGLTFPQYAPGRSLARVMLLLPPESDIAACRHHLRAQGIQTRLGYQIPFPSQAATAKAEALAARLLGVPCGASVSAADAQEICQRLSSIFSATNATLPTSRKQEVKSCNTSNK